MMTLVGLKWHPRVEYRQGAVVRTQRGASESRRRTQMGIETLQKAALAAGFAMATPDDNPPVDDIPASSPHEPFRQTGQWLVPVAGTPQHHTARDSFATALTWVRNHLPMAGGGRAPA
jgi:hypothetical protein